MMRPCKLSQRWHAIRHPWTMIVVIAGSWLSVGCGTPPSSHAIAEAEAAYQRARQYLHQRQYMAAAQCLDQALATHHLRADQLGDAYLWRALCEMEQRAFDRANADLEFAARVVSPETILAARSHLARCQGRSREADEFWKRARAINPHVRPVNEGS